MKMIYRDHGYQVIQAEKNTIVTIQAPAYRTDASTDIEYVLKPIEDGIYADEDHRVELTVEQKNDHLFYIHRKWINCSGSTLKLQTVFRVSTKFAVEHYLIPCVNINGNEFGAGDEPKGLTRDGKKWIFSYDRESIPSCTLVENREIACALFVSGESAISLQSSCSLTGNADGTFDQEIYHPVIEAPLTYADRDGYAPEYQTYLELGAGESFESGFYLSVSEPRWENFGICDVLDDALELFGEPLPYPTPDGEEYWNRSIAFAKSLITTYKGKKGFNIGFIPDKNDGFVYRMDDCYELAWCGQNVLLSRMLIEDAVRNRHPENMDLALEILDTRVAYCTAENGLLAAQLRDFSRLQEASSDTCNMGYGAYEFLRCYERLRELGIDKPQYLEAGKGLCDFFCVHYSDEYGFGKQWRHDGTCIDQGGSIGAFVIPAMCKLYELTKDEKYLATAEKALEFYVKRDLDQFVCTAGALDTCCVDKETSTPFIISAVMLYDLTGKEIYKTIGEKAAYYFTSWMYHYQPVYEADSEISCFNVQTKGLTSVSAQHHHLDLYAGLAVPYIRRLAKMLGDERMMLRAEMMWRSVLQFIGDGKWEIHNRVRPVGSQNEAVFHCRWQSGHEKRGSLNDWLVAWPCAFRLSVLAEEFNHPA